MTLLARIVTIPFFFLWLWNIRIPIGREEVFVQFVYIGFASLFLLIIMLIRNLELRRSSLTATILLVILLVPTIWYQISGTSGEVAFEHSADFPTTEIVKLLLVFLVFVTFNELLYYEFVTIDFLFTVFLVCIIASIVKYLFEYQDVILNLHVDDSRPEAGWIGGWNIYAFLLALACMILLGPLQLARSVRYALLILIIATMFTTLSRGGVVALSVGLFLYWRASLRSGNWRKWVRTPFAVGAIAAMLLGAAIVAGVESALYERYISTSLEAQSAEVGYLQSVSSGRTEFWLDAVLKLAAVETYYQWFLGYGVGHYVYPALRGPETDIGNQYLQFIYEYGLLGGAALTLWMFKGYSALRWDSDLRWAQTMKAMFAVFLVSSFFAGTIYATQAGWLVGIGAAIVVDMLRSVRSMRYSPASSARTPSVPHIGVKTA